MTVAQRASAADTLERKGQTVTLTRRAASSYDPAAGAPTVTTSTQTAVAVILPKSPIRDMSGTAVPSTQRQCLLSALSTSGVALTAPKVNDTLTDTNSDVWVITEVSPLSPAGLDILYELTLKGAGA